MEESPGGGCFSAIKTPSPAVGDGVTQLRYSFKPPVASNADHKKSESKVIERSSKPPPMTREEKRQDGNNEPTNERVRKKRKPSENLERFPTQLMDALTENDDSDAFMWLEDGMAFAVCNKAEFVSSILQKILGKKEIKYVSFVRRMYRWGFMRASASVAGECFWHPHFRKQQRALTMSIRPPAAQARGERPNRGRKWAAQQARLDELARLGSDGFAKPAVAPVAGETHG